MSKKRSKDKSQLDSLSINKRADINRSLRNPKKYDSKTKFFKELIVLFHDNNLLNQEAKKIKALSSKFTYEFSEYFDNPLYTTVLKICRDLLDRTEYYKTPKLDRIRSKRKRKTEKLGEPYYRDSRITINTALANSVECFQKMFPSRNLTPLYGRLSYTLEFKVMLDFFHKIVYVEEIIKGKIENVDRKTPLINDKSKPVLNDPIDSNDIDALNQILLRFQQNADEVEITSLIPLIENVEFFELVLDNKILFVSKKEPRLSRGLCLSLIELSEKKGFTRKAGNPNAKLNAIGPANEFAKKMGPIFEELQSKGFKTLNSKVVELNSRGIRTSRNKEWSITTVKRTNERWQKLKAEEENKSSNTSQSPKP